MNTRINDYARFVGDECIARIRGLAKDLQGTTLLHVNSTSTGGGVAEMLHRLLPLFSDLGLKTRWEVLSGTPLFFQTTKTMHNALQGKDLQLTAEMKREYEVVNRCNAERMDLTADVVMIHDPQPAPFIVYRPKKKSSWFWRCHIDLSHPNFDLWQFLLKYVKLYDISIFSSHKFVSDFGLLVAIVAPSIDPLAEKNIDLTREQIEAVYTRYEIPRDKPILLQVSRFDIFKDPLGVIEVYNRVKEQCDCRLVLAGGGATDDPEGEAFIAQVREQASCDPQIHILPPQGQTQLTDVEINALQRGAEIIIQKSLREGFALTVTEALWKKKPIVATAVGGIPRQVIDGKTGLLSDSIAGTASKILRLLHDRKLAADLGIAGYNHVRDNFLITRHLEDYLQLMTLITRR
ncbi:glycosyltransferase [Candidatus Acetothermia bacterium]|nr:glycosyltransferase [Candidatus Acetothermia bacterium]